MEEKEKKIHLHPWVWDWMILHPSSKEVRKSLSQIHSSTNLLHHPVLPLFNQISCHLPLCTTLVSLVLSIADELELEGVGLARSLLYTNKAADEIGLVSFLLRIVLVLVRRNSSVRSSLDSNLSATVLLLVLSRC